MLRYSCAGSGQERKNGLGGRRNPLKRLNSDKEIKGFPLIFLAQFGQVWENFGLTLENQTGAALGSPRLDCPMRAMMSGAGAPPHARGRVRRRLRRKEAPGLCELQKKAPKQLKGLSSALDCTLRGAELKLFPQKR